MLRNSSALRRASAITHQAQHAQAHAASAAVCAVKSGASPTHSRPIDHHGLIRCPLLHEYTVPPTRSCLVRTSGGRVCCAVSFHTPPLALVNQTRSLRIGASRSSKSNSGGSDSPCAVVTSTSAATGPPSAEGPPTASDPLTDSSFLQVWLVLFGCGLLLWLAGKATTFFAGQGGAAGEGSPNSPSLISLSMINSYGRAVDYEALAAKRLAVVRGEHQDAFAVGIGGHEGFATIHGASAGGGPSSSLTSSAAIAAAFGSGDDRGGCSDYRNPLSPCELQSFVDRSFAGMKALIITHREQLRRELLARESRQATGLVVGVIDSVAGPSASHIVGSIGNVAKTVSNVVSTDGATMHATPFPRVAKVAATDDELLAYRRMYYDRRLEFAVNYGLAVAAKNVLAAGSYADSKGPSSSLLLPSSVGGLCALPTSARASIAEALLEARTNHRPYYYGLYRPDSQRKAKAASAAAGSSPTSSSGSTARPPCATPVTAAHHHAMAYYDSTERLHEGGDQQQRWRRGGAGGFPPRPPPHDYTAGECYEPQSDQEAMVMAAYFKEYLPRLITQRLLYFSTAQSNPLLAAFGVASSPSPPSSSSRPVPSHLAALSPADRDLAVQGIAAEVYNHAATVYNHTRGVEERVALHFPLMTELPQRGERAPEINALPSPPPPSTPTMLRPIDSAAPSLSSPPFAFRPSALDLADYHQANDVTAAPTDALGRTLDLLGYDYAASIKRDEEGRRGNGKQ